MSLFCHFIEADFTIINFEIVATELFIYFRHKKYKFWLTTSVSVIHEKTNLLSDGPSVVIQLTIYNHTSDEHTIPSFKSNSVRKVTYYKGFTIFLLSYHIIQINKEI